MTICDMRAIILPPLLENKEGFNTNYGLAIEKHLLSN